MDPNSLPVPAGKDEWSRPPEILNEVAIALRKGIDGMGACVQDRSAVINSADKPVALLSPNPPVRPLTIELVIDCCMNHYLGSSLIFSASVFLPVAISVPGFSALTPSLAWVYRMPCAIIDGIADGDCTCCWCRTV